MRSSWRKSSYSTAEGNCVEVADNSSRVLVRDSKQNGVGPMLRFSAYAWRQFAVQVKSSLVFTWTSKMRVCGFCPKGLSLLLGIRTMWVEFEEPRYVLY
jgi:Domain of unknown function (DUF397)